MAEAAWHLLATLEGGSLLVATTVLLAYTTSRKLTKKRRRRIAVKSVLLSSTTSELGRQLKSKLEANACTVRVSSENMDPTCMDKVDALVVIGAEAERGLDGMSQQVTQDVLKNLNFLETLSHSLNRGGCIAWACAGSNVGGEGGAFTAACTAFDAVLRASLQYIAKNCHCDGIWIDRSLSLGQTVDCIVQELLPPTNLQEPGFSFRNTAHNVTLIFGRCLKMVT